MSSGITGVLNRVNGQLLSFVSVLPSSNATAAPNVCNNAVVLIPGLTDGMMSMCYTKSLNAALLSIDYSLVQLNLSSSFYQFGFQDLEQDKSDIQDILNFLKREYKFDKIILCGHSTGCQDILYLLRYGEVSRLIDGVILQGGVSDRDDILSTEDGPAMIAEAEKLKSENKAEYFVTYKHCDAPITASRLLSLAGRLTKDDMFSVDLTKEELAPILQPVTVPILIVYSSEDEYVPDKEGQRAFADRMVEVLKSTSPSVQLEYIEGADHGLSTGGEAFVQLVTDFIKKQF
ncbi:PREDICTED: uncharacterized protein LOC105314416 [Amphimedon queenslandica]|nr:PREDICTED: uncharacterized protein LOC105314416 [Amphimedon queenslandica]|eukprot:XP_011406884.1 PREDICTED: uncharacterized protein LOC105314416 [Amphimedon queenslandica]